MRNVTKEQIKAEYDNICTRTYRQVAYNVNEWYEQFGPSRICQRVAVSLNIREDEVTAVVFAGNY